MLLSAEATGRPRKRSIALVIEEPDGSDPSWLLVQRPFDDQDLPGEWGLPAGSLEPDETPEALVRRIGRQKLGVSLTPARQLTSGRAMRPGYMLDMTLWAARIASGTIEVPRPDARVTQYRDWDWRPPEALSPGAARGSLCCRLGLDWAGEGGPGRSDG